MTFYGGDTAAPGSAKRQFFAVEAEGRLASVTNIWAIELTDTQFAYELRREGRRFRVAFDLSRTVDAPPAPWGW